MTSPARVGEFGRGHEARKPGADHDGVCVHAAPPLSSGTMLSTLRLKRTERVRTCRRACRTSFVFSALPTPQTVLAMVTPTPAAIMAYSIAVAPRSSASRSGAQGAKLPDPSYLLIIAAPYCAGWSKAQSSVVRCATSGTSAGGMG